MMLIRKRMAVENWLDDRLVQLCDGTVELDIDLDKVLDLNTTTERRDIFWILLKGRNALRHQTQSTIFSTNSCKNWTHSESLIVYRRCARPSCLQKYYRTILFYFDT
uniref:Uncharacterized protein n=1 Tax=Parascaris univalens TaxID=6257 RepID=A0A915BBC9_PARUN